MNSPDLQDLRQLALLAELTRPLSHECNNFLNNLLLQLAISEKSFPESSRAEWANIRREAKKIASLFQQWQRLRKESTDGPTKIELNQLIQETLDPLRSEAGPIELLFRPAGDAVWLTGFRGEVQRLFVLLLRYAIAGLKATGIENHALEIRLSKSRDRAQLCLACAGPIDTSLLWADFDDLASSERATLSLPALTCKSLVERLDGEVHIERDANGSMALIVDLRLTVS